MNNKSLRRKQICIDYPHTEVLPASAWVLVPILPSPPLPSPPCPSPYKCTHSTVS